MSDLGAGFIGGNHGHDGGGQLDRLAVGVDLHMGTFHLGHLTELDVLMEEGRGLVDGVLDGTGLGRGGQDFGLVGSLGLDHVRDHLIAELDELRGLGHEVGLCVELDRIAGLPCVGLDHLGGDQTFLGLAAFTGAGGLDATGADDLLGAIDVAFGFCQRLLDVHHACAGFITHLLDEGGGYFLCHCFFTPCQQ